MDSLEKQINDKFGQLIEIRPTNRTELKLLIKRDQPVFPERPYMTITYSPNGGFYWGHYDLTLQHALDVFSS